MGTEVWERLVSPRQEITLVLIYWQAKINELDTDHLYVDLAKSFERAAWRADGFVPPPLRSSSCCNWKPWQLMWMFSLVGDGYELMGLRLCELHP